MSKNYQVGLVITGNAKGGVKAINLTKTQLDALNKKQKETKDRSKDTSVSFSKMAKSATVLTAGIAATTAVIGGLVSALRTEAIREMQIMSNVLQINVKDMSEWSYAAQTLNLQNDKMADIFKDVSDKIGDFVANGAGEAGDIFKNLGLDIEKVAGLSPDKQLEAIAKGLDSVSTRGEKVFYLEALANDASRLLPLLENNARGLQEAKREAELLGLSLSGVDAEMVKQAGDQFVRLKGLAEGAANQFTIALSPAIAGVTKSITDSVVATGGWKNVFDGFVENSLVGIGAIGNILNDLYAVVMNVKLGWLFLAKSALDFTRESGEAVIELINTVLKPFQLFMEGLAKGLSVVFDSAGTSATYLGEQLNIKSLKSAGDYLTSFGTNLEAAASSINSFKVTINGLNVASTEVDAQIASTAKQLADLGNLDLSTELLEWWKAQKKAAEEAAQAAAEANKQNAESGGFTSDIDKHNKELDSLLAKVDSFGGAWSRTGSVIVDAFGGIASALDDYSQRMEEISELTLDLKEEKKKYGETSKEGIAIQNSLNKLESEGLRANLQGMSQLTGAASKMFGEQSKGREALHRMEMVFAAAEIAMSLQKAAANALTAITNQGQGDPYTAFARIAAMAAIMAGLGVFAGSVSGGNIPTAQQNQETQGTGTVFGSNDKSGSIAASVARFEDIELDQLAELRGIHDSLRDLNNGITRLATSLVAGFDFDANGYAGQLGKSNWTSGTAAGNLGVALLGGLGGLAIDKLMGGFAADLLGGLVAGLSSKRRELVDAGISFVSQTLGDVLASGELEAQVYNTIKTTRKKLFGLIKSESTKIEYSEIDGAIESQLGAIFGHISDTVVSAAELLGLGTEQEIQARLANFRLNISNLSLFELDGEELQQELDAVISSEADRIAAFVFRNISQYQKIGEGAYETLLRVAQEQAVFNDHLDRMGLALGDLAANELIDVTQNIIELVGGLDEFKDASNAYFSEFFSEQEQFEYLQKSLQEVMASINLTLPESRQGFRDLVESIEWTTDEGQRLLATLFQISPAAAEYYKELERQTGVTQDNTALLAERARVEADVAKALEQMDFSQLERALDDLNSWYVGQINTFDELGADTTLLETLYGRQRQQIIDDALQAINDDTARQMDALTREHESAVSSVVSDYQRLFDALARVSGSIETSMLSIRRSQSGWDEIGYQSSRIDTLRGQLGTGSPESQINTVESLLDATMSRYQAEMDANNRLIDAAQARYDQELSAYERIKDAVAGLKDFADSLLYSDFSVLSQGDQLDAARSHFESLSSAARRGDVNAIGQLQSVGQNYLRLAQSYYATGSDQYGDIFEQVQSALRSTRAPGRPSVPREVQAYQDANLLIQEQALTELADLQTLLDELNAEMITNQTSELESLEITFKEAQAALLAVEQEQIDAINSAADQMVAAIQTIDVAPVVKVTSVPPPTYKPENYPKPVETPADKNSAKTVELLEQNLNATHQQIRQLQKVQESLDKQLREAKKTRHDTSQSNQLSGARKLA